MSGGLAADWGSGEGEGALLEPELPDVGVGVVAVPVGGVVEFGGDVLAVEVVVEASEVAGGELEFVGEFGGWRELHPAIPKPSQHPIFKTIEIIVFLITLSSQVRILTNFFAERLLIFGNRHPNG